ncbi:MAG: ATP-dependent Clp protease ATP-binding subunit [Patescibacteria group bacterium]
MNILDRFSTHLKEIIARAMQIAAELKNPEVEPLHLLFAMMNEKGSLASEVLGRFKLDLKILEQMLLAISPESDVQKLSGRKNIDQIQMPPLSSLAKLCLEKAMIAAQKNTHSHLGSEHLLFALLDLDDQKLNEYFKVANVKVDALRKEVEGLFASSAQFPDLAEVSEAMEDIQDNFLPPQMSLPRKHRGKNEESALDYFSINLTDPKNQKNIDPVIGREVEIERLIQILSRRTKNNPILLGDPGVGKTAIVEGLAKKILEGKVPDELRRKKIFSADLGLLVAGTIYRGEFEARLKELIDDASKDPDVILFIDEIHNIVGAGSSQGSMDAANLLKPALARGQIHCIGSTTPAEFKKFIESDAALERRFMPIFVREPSIDEAKQILLGLKKNYEDFHRVDISDEAVNAAVELSARYISGKFLPDKAIDLLDETAAAKKLSVGNSREENQLAEMREKFRSINSQKEKAALGDNFAEALKLRDESTALIREIGKLEKVLEKQKSKHIAQVVLDDVIRQVARVTGHQPAELIADNRKKYDNILREIKKSVVGQDSAVEYLVAHIRQADLGLSDQTRPSASLLFVGPSGTGKTETAKTLAKVLFPGQDALIRLDMSEFGESYGASKLLGSPAGYVGYKEANQFTDRLKLHPYSVVLFDEIDKAHPDILKLLLQMLEEGEITDATGKKISLKHAIIILTTSFGADELKKGNFGFSTGASSTQGSAERIREKLKERFSPELINRLDQICLFNELTPENLAQIAGLEIAALNERLKKYRTAVAASGIVLQKFITSLEIKSANARDIRRRVRADIEKFLADIIVKGAPKKSYSLQINKNELSLK